MKTLAWSLVIALCLALCSGCAAPPKTAYIVPNEEAPAYTGDIFGAAYRYILPESNQSFVVSIEQWEGGSLIGTEQLCVLEGSEGVFELAANEADSGKAILWFTAGSQIMAPMEDYSTSPSFWCVLENGELEELNKRSTVYADGVAVACIGVSESSEKIEPVSCAAITDDSSILGRYASAQVARLVLSAS